MNKIILTSREEPNKGRGKNGLRHIIVDFGGDPLYSFEINERDDKSWWRTAKYEVEICKKDSSYVFGLKSDTVGYCDHVAKGRKIIREYLGSHPELFESERKSQYSAAYLPAGNNADFFPTPMKLAGRMLAKVKWEKVSTILEPSAGKGDLVEATVKYAASSRKSTLYKHHRNDVTDMFDVVEMDTNLRLMLRGAGYRLVSDDFLTYAPQKRYDVILMNPPFSNGARHLLHAIELQKNGGQIVCLLNAETIRNPYTKERQILKQKLAEHEARIEFIQDAFKHAERASDVEVAIVYINIAARPATSDIFAKIKKDEEHYEFNSYIDGHQMVVADELKALVAHYDFEAKLGIALMEEYNALTPYIMDGKSEYASPIIELSINGHTHEKVTNEVVNEYLKKLRGKYWSQLLEMPSVRSKLTSQMASDYYDKVREMRDYPFNLHNIMQVVFDIQTQLQQGVVDAIMKLFDTFSGKYAYSEEIDNGNVHYYNGWATNKAWKVGKKIVLPIRGYCSSSWRKNELDSRYIDDVFSDLDRSLCFLDNGKTTPMSTYIHVLDQASSMGKNEVDCAFFRAKFYKKGTCHITFHDDTMPLIERLNIFAARQRGWLPPAYGKKSYKDMDEKEREVIDDFQGEAAYDEVMQNPSAYILEASSMQPMLTA